MSVQVSLVLLSPLASCLHLRSSSGLLQAPARSLINVQHNLGAQCGASGGNHDAEMRGTVLECSEGGGIFGCSTWCRQERGGWTS